MAVTITRQFDDVVFRGAKVSHFGDPNDTEDNGLGAWGFEYIRRPDFPGIALPIPVIDKYNLSQYHPVKVYNPANNRVVFCFLIDKGPAVRTGRHADLLIGPWKALGFPAYGADDPGEALLDFRIVNVK